MKVLLIGYGNMGKNHYRVMQKLLKTTQHELKVCDLNEGQDYTNYRKAIDEYEPTHVIIATTTSTHGDILNYCVSKKVRNVLVEKPIIDGYGAEIYMDVKDTRIMVGHIERYNPVVSIAQNLVKGKEIDTIICTRSGLIKNEEDYDLHMDLCIHDADVCQLLTKHLVNVKTRSYSRNSKSNSCNIFAEINGVDCFLHADNKSPFKKRAISIMGPGYLIEGDYYNQKIWHNGEEIHISKVEPLYIELDTFFKGRFTKEDLKEAINNLKIVRM